MAKWQVYPLLDSVIRKDQWIFGDTGLFLGSDAKSQIMNIIHMFIVESKGINPSIGKVIWETAVILGDCSRSPGHICHKRSGPTTAAHPNRMEVPCAQSAQE